MFSSTGSAFVALSTRSPVTMASLTARVVVALPLETAASVLTVSFSAALVSGLPLRMAASLDTTKRTP